MNHEQIDGAAAELADVQSDRTGVLSDYVSRQELQALNDFSTRRVIIDGALMWAVILAALAIAGIANYWLVSVLCFVVIASRQLALTHMVHDASHLRLFPDRKVNDLVSDIFFAAPVMITTQQYRAQHLEHHKHLGHSQLDTDRRAWYSIHGWQFLRRSARILAGGEAIATFLSYAGHGSETKAARSGMVRRLVLVAITNLLLLGYCVWLRDITLYIWLWLLPMFTLTMYLLTLRVIAEHQTVDYSMLSRDAFELSLPDPLIRTLQPGPLGRFFLGAVNFFYHHEHHLAPSIRYANLPKLHALLRARGYYDKYPEALGQGYYATLRDLVLARAATNGDAIKTNATAGQGVR
jgi:fatty acid desaturase